VRDGVIIVLQRGQHFLVGKRAPHKPAPGYWTQLSGKVEPGESQRETVVREAMEEVGCEVLPVRKLQQGPSSNGEFMLHYWLAKIIEGEPRICDDELAALRWVTVAQLRDLSPIFQQDIDVMTDLGQGVS
jgi:8-oxo-dGTP diphosphatase